MNNSTFELNTFYPDFLQNKKLNLFGQNLKIRINNLPDIYKKYKLKEYFPNFDKTKNDKIEIRNLEYYSGEVSLIDLYPILYTARKWFDRLFVEYFKKSNGEFNTILIGYIGSGYTGNDDYK